MIMNRLIAQLKFMAISKTFMWILLVVDTLGTIYGYYLVYSQLEITETIFLIFVPDSPTASLFFLGDFRLAIWSSLEDNRGISAYYVS